MTPRSWFYGSLVWTLSTLAPAAVLGDDYPTKTISIYTAAAGGNADITARLIAQHANLGQPVVVVNQSAAVAAQTVADAAPDGHALLFLGKSFYLSPVFQETVPYDPVKDFAPVTMVSSAPNVLVTHPTMPETVEGIIAMAKEKPGVLNYATGASGGAGHLAAELFKELAGLDMVRVVYKGGGPSMVGVASNESQLSFGPPAQVQPLVASGKMRAVAVTSLKPSEVMPGLPPMAQFLPGFEMTSTQGVWTTAGTPAAVIDRLNQEIKRILELPDVKQQLLQQGAEAAYTTPQEFAAAIDADITLTRKLMEKSK